MKNNKYIGIRTHILTRSRWVEQVYHKPIAFFIALLQFVALVQHYRFDKEKKVEREECRDDQSIISTSTLFQPYTQFTVAYQIQISSFYENSTWTKKQQQKKSTEKLKRFWCFCIRFLLLLFLLQNAIIFGQIETNWNVYLKFISFFSILSLCIGYTNKCIKEIRANQSKWDRSSTKRKEMKRWSNKIEMKKNCCMKIDESEWMKSEMKTNPLISHFIPLNRKIHLNISFEFRHFQELDSFFIFSSNLRWSFSNFFFFISFLFLFQINGLKAINLKRNTEKEKTVIER